MPLHMHHIYLNGSNNFHHPGSISLALFEAILRRESKVEPREREALGDQDMKLGIYKGYKRGTPVRKLSICTNYCARTTVMGQCFFEPLDLLIPFKV